MEIKNRKINDYLIESTFTAGLILVGMEIKSLVNKEADITGSRCMLKTLEGNSKNFGIFIVGSYFKVKESAYSAKYDANRDRQLLIKKCELNYIKQQAQKGRSIIPTKIFCADSKKYKVEIAVCLPLKKYDKREKLREREDWKQLRE